MPQVELALECPSCGGRGEPEQDGECQFYSCEVCQYEFGYSLLKQDAGSCQVGVPAQVRTRFQQPQRSPSGDAPVFLGTIGRRPA